MVNVKSDSDTRTHELEGVDIDNDPSKASETCVGDPSSPSTDGKLRDTTPTNYLRVSKRGLGVKGQYVLDLSLPPPPPSASGIPSGQDCKNLSLSTTSGSIDADIWIIYDEVVSVKPKRVSMELSTDNGVIRVKVHDPSSTNENGSARPALDLNVRAHYGDISVSLPRCFRGPITISTGDERVAFSPAIEDCMSLLSDIPGLRVYFVCERPIQGKWGHGNKKDKSSGDPLDELSVGGRFSSVRINWDGERELPVMKPSGWHNFCGGTERFFTSGRVC